MVTVIRCMIGPQSDVGVERQTHARSVHSDQGALLMHETLRRVRVSERNEWEDGGVGRQGSDTRVGAGGAPPLEPRPTISRVIDRCASPVYNVYTNSEW